MTRLGPGTRLTDNLTLVRVLGEGGMGTVWLAEHRALGSEVAVKVMHPELGRRDPTLLERFTAEARAAAKVRHPHIVQVFDCGVTADGVAWLSMERLEGESLREALDAKGRVSVEFAREVLHQVCGAVAKAHEAGIVHRDLKPENLFVADVSGKPYVKVLDFGIAKRVDAASGMTATGQVFGTPAYMSPEQLLSTKSVDAQADLWALAVIVYELLTGRLPFSGETSSAIAVAVAMGQFVSATAVEPGLGPAVDGFFARAFARSASARFGSAEELARALVAALEGTAPARAPAAAPPLKPAATEVQLPAGFAGGGRHGTEVA
ncbi:MAG: serine/threonine protein kinase, partial [Deltaproteobacteria bacterium]|nr:serine/threonine protein kinase [Deltaproteobacteria bacterium]